ncbi:hypothetical protein KY339_01710 [Candidatus Woesearchaeota archaeon]|nr:hypothetical protein [Candidatus Woesearchaeota archaeon]
MTDLVACLSSGKGTWAHVGRLVAEGPFENIFLITNDFGKQNFKPEKPVNFIVTDSMKPVDELIKDIINGLKDKIKGVEVGLNLVSGSGKEHMAILSALLKLGLAIRLVALTKEGVKEI